MWKEAIGAQSGAPVLGRGARRPRQARRRRSQAVGTTPEQGRSGERLPVFFFKI